ncbi:MAG: DUF2784 domain-containing protein [Caulobacterales bacterium]|nr:DUF2784 domain-containing protein [Caulobacterales bacterium]
MLASLLADAILVLHFAWIVFTVGGGLLAFKWRAVIWIHPPVAAWSAWVITAGRICPLTPLENRYRRIAGEVGFDEGFIEHYLTAIIYPDGLTRTAQVLLGVALVIWSRLVYRAVLKYRRGRR